MIDDLHMVRDLLAPAPPPTAEVTDAARARLMAAVTGQAPGHPGPGRRAARRLATVPRWRLAVPALAMAAAVAVAATLLAGGHVTGRQIPAGQPAHLTARDVLLTAATAAAATAAPGTGKYQVQTWVTGDLLVSGPNSHPYVIERRNGLSATWQPTSSSGTMTTYRSANYTSRLPTPGATAAWRADGSPPLPRQSGQRPQVVKENVGQSFGNENLTLAQLQALPSSTAGLKEAIVKGLQAKPNPFEGVDPVGNTGITDVCVGLIRSAVITPGVRAAAFRIIAAMPGISVTGLVKDPLGRTGYDVTLPGVGGISVGATGTNATPKAQYRMVISPSGAVLATEYVAVTPTTNLVPVMPASGAIPGPTSCQAGQEQIGNQCFIKYPAQKVLPSAAKGARYVAGTGLGGPVLTLDAPVLAVPAGTLVEYVAFLGSGLTNAMPSATIPSLPPVSAASPSAPASPSPAAPSQSPSPVTPSPTTASPTTASPTTAPSTTAPSQTTAPSAPSPTLSATSPASSPSASTPSPAQSSSSSSS
ncbi:MAG: hypothetical protein JWM19_7516 [Actinomycetia bacterium]|nr:hypothetical protein [Actinomycetes bacterium]